MPSSTDLTNKYKEWNSYGNIQRAISYKLTWQLLPAMLYRVSLPPTKVETRRTQDTASSALPVSHATKPKYQQL